MDPRKRIITPAEALLRARIRPRVAPPVRPSARIRGWVDWRLVDRRGREVRGGQSPNMWLNQGLDAIAAMNGPGGMFGWTSSPNKIMTGLQYAAVGTGSEEPDPTDTTLGAEVGRSNSHYTNGTITNNAPGVYTLSKTLLFDYGEGNGNLTEWGMAGASSGELRTRALFVDDLGSPITITKTSDYQLRLTYNLQLTFTPVELTPASMTITGIGTLNGNIALASGSNNLDFHFFTSLAGGWLGDSIALNNRPAGIGLSTNASYAYGANLNTQLGDRAGTLQASTYNGGTYSRSYSGTFSPAQGNLTGVRQLLGLAAGARAFTFLVDSEDAFTKTNENILTLENFITVTWGRDE